MTTYTPTQGLTPTGQQLAQGQPNSVNTQAPPGDMIGQLGSGQELSPTQLTSLTGSYGTAANQLGNMQTSDARQGYVSNSNIPAMQTNYDDLARKLFEYDSGTLSPQFQGTNPGMPSDAASFGRVDASPLAMTMQAAGLPASQGLFAGSSNPKYAYASQIGAGNNITSLLDTLNSSIGQEFSQRAGTYKNTVDKQSSLLKAISDILDMNRQTSLTKAQINAENARSAASIRNQKDMKALELGEATFDAKGNVIYLDSTSPVTSGKSGKGISADRKAAQDKYNALPPQSPLRGKIANAWKSAYGYPLFQGNLTADQATSLKQTASAMHAIDDAVYLLQSGKVNESDLGSLMGNLHQGLLQNQKTRGLLKGDLGQLGSDLLLIQAVGDKNLMGGRLIDSLVRRFGGAFPSLAMDKSDILGHLTYLQQEAANNASIGAKSLGYDDPSALFEDYGIRGVTKAQVMGADRQGIINTLKAKGKDDNYIHAYLRQKGID
jgi:hypothetical protein